MTTIATFDEFTEAFIAALVEKGLVVLDPNAESTNLGIGRVHALISLLAEKSEKVDEQRWFIRVKNSLAPSNIGTYDYFLAALRSCQLGFASSPNPRYSEIAFRVSKPHAEHFLDKLDPLLRATAESAAEAFIGEPESMDDSLRRGLQHVNRGRSGVAA